MFLWVNLFTDGNQEATVTVPPGEPAVKAGIGNNQDPIPLDLDQPQVFLSGENSCQCSCFRGPGVKRVFTFFQAGQEPDEASLEITLPSGILPPARHLH